MGLSNFYRGDTYSVNVDLSAYGISIAGHTLTLTLKALIEDADGSASLQFEYTVPSGSSADAGLATITVPSSLTDLLDPGSYHYDVQWDQGGDPNTVLTILASGTQPDFSEVEKITVLPDITRTTS